VVSKKNDHKRMEDASYSQRFLEKDCEGISINIVSQQDIKQ